MSPPPSPADGLQVHISSVEAALTKLNVEIPIEDLIKVIYDEEEARRARLTAESERVIADLDFAAISQPVSGPIEPGPSAMERRRRLVSLTKEAFPGDKAPSPSAYPVLGLSSDTAANKLPFIHVSRIVITSTENRFGDRPKIILEDVWCLWDTGAQISFIATSQLPVGVRNNQTEGSAHMEITFSGVAQAMNTAIFFRPQLPNGVTFIILGQHGLLDHLHYEILPVSIDPLPYRHLPNTYGLIKLIAWRNAETDVLVSLGHHNRIAYSSLSTVV